jgi:hypothetical protein
MLLHDACAPNLFFLRLAINTAAAPDQRTTSSCRLAVVVVFPINRWKHDVLCVRALSDHLHSHAPTAQLAQDLNDHSTTMTTTAAAATVILWTLHRHGSCIIGKLHRKRVWVCTIYVRGLSSIDLEIEMQS